MGDCYLYSGGAGEARDHYGKVRAGARVAVKIAQCCELSGKPDSAIHYYSKALGHLSPPVVADPARLRYALLVCDRDGLETALAGLDSPFPAIRARLRQPRAMVAAYALGQRGYIDLAAGLLGAVSPGGDGSGCEALLLLSRLESGEEPKAKLARLGEGETRCSSIFGALRLLHERAYLACSSGPLETCVRERKRYQQRFPLDQRARFGFDVHRALLSYQEGRGEAATSIVDSLAATGRKHDALAYGLYRKGIHHMLEGDYALAKQAFGAVEREYADSELYFDALFKLGTACYMLEQYDSSAFYFEQTARSPKPSLVEDAYFNLGLALEEGGRPEQASDAFMKLAVRFPFSERFERALMRAAYTRQQAGLPDQAIPIYEDLLQYAEDPETAAEAMYWIGESFAEMGDALRAACEFLRVVRLFPGGGPWTGTAAYRAGLECEKAGLVDHALIVYRENVSSFGTGTDWGRASQERLDELQREPAGGLGPQEPDEGTENVSEPVGRRGENPTGR
jgi:TolA-binding protein